MRVRKEIGLLRRQGPRKYVRLLRGKRRFDLAAAEAAVAEAQHDVGLYEQLMAVHGTPAAALEAMRRELKAYRHEPLDPDCAFCADIIAAEYVPEDDDDG